MTPSVLRRSHLLVLLVLLAASVLGAAVSPSNWFDALMSFAAGAMSVLLLVAVTGYVLTRRQQRRARDTAVLDGLEPLGPGRRGAA